MVADPPDRRGTLHSAMYTWPSSRVELVVVQEHRGEPSTSLSFCMARRHHDGDEPVRRCDGAQVPNAAQLAAKTINAVIENGAISGA